MAERLIVQRGKFLDSVALMLLSRDAAGLDGVEQASVVNATPLNVDLVEGQGFAIAADEKDELGPNDLLIAIRAGSEEALDVALAVIEERLRERRPAELAGGDRVPVRSVTAAARRRGGELSLALVSVPGGHAAYECARALDAGLDVFCFSTGPSLDAEAALKARAGDLGLLLMGPDCGTAILNGVALGFGNATRPGPVGIVGASGTGIQAVTCRLDAAGVGISQAIGTGGRDLSARVGGAMTHRAIEMLSADADTEAIVVIAKAPDPEVARRVVTAAVASGKAAVFVFPGFGAEERAELGFDVAPSLEEAAGRAARSIGEELPPPERLGTVETTPGAIRGLFSGGTLRDEAMTIVAGVDGGVGHSLEQADRGAHVLLDLGDERFTEGRPHPMIDQSLRLSILERQARDPDVGVLLLDVVLGYAAHPDPAAELGPAIEHAARLRSGALSVIVSLCGTNDDPQGLRDQADRLHRAGALVTRSNADAAELALAAAGLAEARA